MFLIVDEDQLTNIHLGHIVLDNRTVDHHFTIPKFVAIALFSIGREVDHAARVPALDRNQMREAVELEIAAFSNQSLCVAVEAEVLCGEHKHDWFAPSRYDL